MASATLIRYNKRARRALGICLATFIALGGTLPAQAQSIKRLPKSLLPAPGNAGITLNLMSAYNKRAVVTAVQHPLFESSWTGDPNEIIATTKYGNVSSRDLYLWMMLRESPNKAYLYQLLQKSKLPDERKTLADGLKVEVDEFIFANYIVPRLMPSVPADHIYNLKCHLYTLPAWQTVFLQKVVRPEVTITEADRQKYLQEHTGELVEPERLRTRYIFMNCPETAPAEEQDRVEVEMDELRASILRGETSFSEAARANSQAPSASNGGEIPPFGHGELFFLFENAAANVEPGGISPVFRGPRGFYMVQLIEVLKPEEPSLSNPKQAKQVDEALSRQVLRGAYDIYMRDMLQERRRIVEKTFAWDSLEDSEMLGKVCNFQITKGEFRNAWPGVETNDLQLRTDIIGPQLRTILEREAMAQEVTDLGFANDPLLERARWMAANIIRRDAWVDQIRAKLPISEELVYDFWQNHPDLFTPMALKRVIKLTMTPSNTVPLPAQTRMELDQVLAQATGQPSTIAIAKRKNLDEERGSLVYDTLERTEGAFNMLTTPPSEPNFYLDEYSTMSLQNMMISDKGSTDTAVENGEPAPGLDEIPAPSGITTNSLESLVDKPTTEKVLDLKTTAPQGGAAPGPAAGGSGPTTTSGKPKIRPATRPHGGAVPVSYAPPVTNSALKPEPTPNVRKQLKPPPTSSTPYNPDWFYARMDGSEIQSIVGHYASSDWLMSMADLGFVYVADLADAPDKLDKVPVGAFSRPIVVGRTSVSWYIEEARKVEKPSFEKIKTHAYEVFRNTQIDKSVTRAYNSELEKANVDYKF